MEFGDSVIVKGKLRRTEDLLSSWKHINKKWIKTPFAIAREGIFLGYRTLFNGYRDYGSEEGYSFTSTEHFKAVLVCCSGRENPFYADLEDVIVSNMILNFLEASIYFV